MSSPADRAANSTPTLLTLVRHGETPWHADNRYAGSSDVGLTETGRAQAAALGEWAARARPDAVACSPLSRSRETAAAVGREPLVVDDLREMDFGVAEGCTLAEVEASHPGVVAAFSADPVANPFPDAETPTDVARRVAAALSGLAVDRSGEHLLVIAHSTALRLALCLLLGLDLAQYRRVFPRLDNAALTRIRLTGCDRPPALLDLNVPLHHPSPHLEDQS